MKYIAYLLLTPFAWVIIGNLLFLIPDAEKHLGGVLTATTILTLALWGIVLLLGI